MVNEDAFGVFEGNNAFVVADGCGGRSSGESAARLTIECFRRVLQEQVTSIDGLTDVDPLAVAVLRANEEVLRASTNPSQMGQGSTVCAVRAFERWVAVAHVGDCRVGRYRDSELVWLTEDHSMVSEMRRCGFPAEQFAKIHDTVLARGVGVMDSVSVDVSYHHASPGDVYLLCSDGLSHHVERNVIAELLGVHSRDLRTCCAALLEASEGAGGHDNATVILLRLRAR